MTYRELDVPPARRRALRALDLLTGKWQPLIVVTLAHHDAMGFNDLLNAIPDISGKVLSETLTELQDAGLVEREEVSKSPLRVEYRLTDGGRDIESVFDALSEWGGRYLDQTIPRVLLADADRRIVNMYGQWLAERYEVVRAHDGTELEVRFDDRLDVVLVDEGLPGMDVQEFVAEQTDRCRIIVLVGDRPAFDLLNIECDDLLRKPILRETAIEAIDDQLSRIGEPADRRERASLSARQSMFESIYRVDQLEASEAYCDLRRHLDELTASLEE